MNWFGVTHRDPRPASMKMRIRLFACVFAVGGIFWSTSQVVSGQPVARSSALADMIDRLMKRAADLEAAGASEKALVVYRHVLRLSPEKTKAYNRVVALAKGARLIDPPGVLDGLAKEFAEGTKLQVTPHFLIVYDTSATFARSRQVLLERTHEMFYKEMTRAGFRPIPLERRLVAVLFNRHEKYIAYAKNKDGIDMGGSAGYYSSRTNRVAFFNNQSNPGLAKLSAPIQQVEKQLANVEKQLSVANREGRSNRIRQLRGVRSRLIYERSRLMNRFMRSAGLNNLSTSAHEAAHQLAYNSGIQRRGAAHPFWLSEGLATNFETIAPALDFGPSKDNALRRRSLKKLDVSGKLVSLARFVKIVRPPGKTAMERSHLYAQAWGLFHYLFNERTESLRKYMREVNRISLAKATPGRMLKAFEDSFGPVQGVETAWRKYVRGLKR